MSEWTQITLSEPLFLLLALPWGYWLYHKWFHSAERNSLGGVRFPFNPLRSGGSQGSWVQFFYAKAILFDLAVGLLILALAQPGIYKEEITMEGEGVDIVVSLDLSSSMLAKDFQPDRLEVSKELMIEFIEGRPLDRIGVVGFAGESFTQSPLTTDHSLLRERIRELECGMIDDGTAIGMGLATALTRLTDTPSGSGVVILLTDGVNNTGYIEPLTAARMASQMGIRVYTIGVGSRGLARAPISRNRDGSLIFGNVRVEIDEELLREISTMTGGLYFRADNQSALEEIYQIIDELEKTEILIDSILHFSPWYRYPSIAALLLLLLYFLPELIFRRFP